jgi:hypothetical protein
MKRWLSALMMILMASGLVATVAVLAQQLSDDEARALRSRIEDRFDVVPLTDGLALRPKTRRADVRLVEISNGAIAVNGVAVSGRELRERLGGDADAVLRLSYLNDEARKSLFAKPPRAEAGEEPAEREPSPPSAVAPSRAERNGRTSRETSRERVRIFGDIRVFENETIAQQVVAVLGSVRVDGEVGDEVVAVLGSVDLGPRAVVRGDVVSVGGRVRRAQGSQVHGAVTEVSFADPSLRVSIEPWLGSWSPWVFGAFGSFPRLLGSAFRFVLLALFASLAMIVARSTVEASAQRVSDNPVKATLVGLAAQLLVIPLLVLTAVVLSISIVGIPLLLLLPFVVLVLLFIALAGFSGTAYAVGQRFRRGMGITPSSPLFDVCLGVLIILLPVLTARVIALAGWPATPIAVALLATGFGVEFLAWVSGFGAALTNAFTRWQGKRAAARAALTPPTGAA